MRKAILAIVVMSVVLGGCGHELMDGPGDPGPLYCIPTEEVPGPSPTPSVTPSPSPSPDPDELTCAARKTPGCVYVHCSDGTSALIKGSKKHCGGA